MKQIVNNVGNAYKATGKPVQVRYDNNGVQISLNTDAEKVSLYADNGSDSLLLDGSDSGEGTHKFINDMSWIYNNLYQKLKKLNENGVDKNSQEYANEVNSITQDMVRIKNDVIDARNNYAWAHPNSKYGIYILGDNGKSEEQPKVEEKKENTSSGIQLVKKGFINHFNNEIKYVKKSVEDVKKDPKAYIKDYVVNKTKAGMTSITPSSLLGLPSPLEQADEVTTMIFGTKEEKLEYVGEKSAEIAEGLVTVGIAEGVGRLLGKLGKVPKGDAEISKSTAKSTEETPNTINGNLLLPESKIGNFLEIENIRDFMSRIPHNAQRLPWKEVPGGAKQGIKYKWTDAQGNKWEVRAHEMDPSAPNNSNASQGWIYRVQVNPKNIGGKWYMDSKGNFYKENIINKSSPFYNETIANDTHIKFTK